MPLYLLVRPSKKGNGKGTKGLHDYMHKRARYGRPQSYPAPTAQNPLPCYVTEEPPVFDEEGKELDPNAEVWKTYVRETNLVDEELVDAWNKSMDVILIFAALFSAISTAFVLESYKSLKQDPADASSQTLLTISQTLMFIANGSQPASFPLSSEADQPAFHASSKDICVNVLWFLSLSLSVAVSLISMLAKEWSLEFMSGRIGLPGAQAHRRQQRWDGVKKWRMQEFLVVLPSLIHLSLLLFAIGLCVFLWDVHYGVAIPVMIVTTIAAIAYLACTVVPFLYDYCPYGTVLSRLVKQLTGIRSQINQATISQPEVTARALDWMITNCETPRVIDLVFRSLAAGDENMPPELFERSNTRAVVKWRMELAGPKESEADAPASIPLDRICKAYVLARSKTDRLNYLTWSVGDALKQPVLSIQLTINSLVREKLSQVDPNDHITIQILQQCMLIGRGYLHQEMSHSVVSYSHEYQEEFDAAHLVDYLVNRLEQYLNGSIGFDPDLHCIFSISLAFVLCCNTDNKHVDKNVEYILSLIRAYSSGSHRLPSDPVRQTVVDSLVLGALWLVLSPNRQDITALVPVAIPREDKAKAFEALWAGCINAVYSDRSALKRSDSKYWTHGMLYLLTNPKRYNFNIYEIGMIEMIIANTREVNDIPNQLQKNYHAAYVQNISRNLSSEFTPQLEMALCRLKEYAPWDDKYILPTPDIHIFVVESILSGSENYWRASYLNDCFPIPKLSPRLAKLLSSGNIITQLSISLEDNRPEIQLFPTAQLWLYLNMSLREPDRSRSDLSTLEQALLKYPRLADDIQKQEQAAEELEDRLTMLFDQVDHNSFKRWLGAKYVCRIFELMLQYRSAPLPEFASTILVDVPTRLPGINSCVNLEDEWLVLYSEARRCGVDIIGQLYPQLQELSFELKEWKGGEVIAGRKQKPLNETFVVVRPPLRVSNHPLNLQLQVIPLTIQFNHAPLSASTSTTRSTSSAGAPGYAAAGVVNILPISSGLRSQRETKMRIAEAEPQQDDELLNRRANKSDLSLFYSSMGSSVSVASFSPTALIATSSGIRRIIPSYNLSAHNVLQDTPSRCTDTTVSRFWERRIDIFGLGILEPVEVHSQVPSTEVVAGCQPDFEYSPTGHDFNLGHGVSESDHSPPFQPGYLSGESIRELKLRKRPSQPFLRGRTSPSSLREVYIPDEAPKESSSVTFFGKLFKKKDSNATLPASPDLLSPTVVTPHALLGAQTRPISTRSAHPTSVHSVVHPSLATISLPILASST
ncbi:DNA-directed RNA polymerase subunit beta'' [Rhizoctonia solani]|uniref:DNA-directed RNA polymerase subunit beta n=1 Tax=Rhizoctonia solani TaxID=456999 RepID=A0A0K6GG22_9AGAM|nr:DNA-directed RNA polymerase subunit beta'' [Rhizoctonia solani]